MAEMASKVQKWTLVRGAIVKKLRIQQKLTRNEIEERVGQGGAELNAQTLKRIEGKGEAPHRLSKRAADGLARVLGVEVGVLTGDRLVESAQLAHALWPDLKLALPRKLHNVLALTSYLYGVSPDMVIGNGLLLFIVASERSLGARRRALEQMREAMHAVTGSWTDLPHLGWHDVRSVGADEVGRPAEEILAAEEDSVAARDIQGERTRDLWPSEYEEEVGRGRSPFTDFLEQEASAIGVSASLLNPYLHPEAFVSPELNEDDEGPLASAIDALVGGDRELKAAIAESDFIIPMHAWMALRNRPLEQRVSAIRRWMNRDEYGVEQRKLREELGDVI